MVAFHGRETDGGNPVCEHAAGLALFVTGNPMALAIAPDDEAMSRGARLGRLGKLGIWHCNSPGYRNQETEAAIAAAVSRKPMTRSILVNLNGAVDGTWVPRVAALMSAFTDDTGSGRWVGT
jgi:hypothetical protein